MAIQLNTLLRAPHFDEISLIAHSKHALLVQVVKAVVEREFCGNISPHGKPLKMRTKHRKELECIALNELIHLKSLYTPISKPIIHYMTDAERDECEVVFKEGKPVRKTTDLPIDFSKEQVDGKIGSMMYVVDTNKRCYLYSNHDEKFAHSSVVAGGYVLSAGEITGTPDGTITGMNNKSGHYRPSERYLRQGLDIMREAGALISEDGIIIVIKSGQID